VAKSLPHGAWVHDGYKGRDYDNGDIIFRPVYVAEHGDNLLWQNGRKFLLMSATILAPSVMAAELGLNLNDKRQWDFVALDSNFPAENRPVHIVPIANMTFGNKAETRPKLAMAVKGVLKRHPDERILIH